VACATTGAEEMTGTITYRERIALPEGAVVRVTLLDVSLLDVPARVVAEQELQPTREVPIPFALRVPRGAFDPEHRYALTATIWDAAGRPLWTTTTAHPVLTGGAARDVSILVRRSGEWAAPGGPRVLAWDCEGLSFRVEVTKERALLFLPGKNLELPAVPAASGAKYSDGSTTWWSRGDEALLTLEGVERRGCRTRPLRER
jgi:putative lipoprotein